MHRTLAMLAAFTLALSIAGAAGAAPTCKSGVPCGNTCIAKGKVCHVTPPKPPVCKTGKPCGNTCIAKDKVCHVAAVTPMMRKSAGGYDTPTESLQARHPGGAN